MSTDEVEELPAIDSDPKGDWSDEHPEANDSEIAEGNRLGDVIDKDDDDDSGFVETVRRPR